MNWLYGIPMVIESTIPFRLGGTRAETIDKIPGVLGLKQNR